MKNTKGIIWVCVWQVLATLALAFVWMRNPDLFFRPPDSFSYWLADLYGSENAESLRDLEVMYVVTVSFVFILILTLIAFGVTKLVAKNSSGR